MAASREDTLSAFNAVAKGNGQADLLADLLAQGLSPDLSEDDLAAVVSEDLQDDVAECLSNLGKPRTSRYFRDFKGKTLLMYAAESGLAACVDVLLRAGAQRDQADANGKTALCYAASAGQVESLDCLLRGHAPASVTTRTANGMTALMYACVGGNVDAVSNLINAQSEIEAENSFGVTAIMWAAMNGHLECVRRLANAGASVNEEDSKKKTALLYASAGGHAHAVEYLLQRGANVHQQDRFGLTTLMHAATGDSAECVRLLVEAGANVNSVDENGSSALLYAILENRRTDCAKTLLNAGMMLDLRDFKAGKTAVIHCVENNRVDFLQLLIEHKADVDLADFSGKTAVMYAVEQNHVQCFTALVLASSAAIDVADCMGATAVTYALETASEEPLRFLVNFGANIQQKDSKGRTLLMIAASRNSHACLQYLIRTLHESHSKESAEHAAAGVGLETPARRNFLEETDHQGRTAVSHAAITNSVTSLELLVEAGAKPNHLDLEGKSPFMYATEHGSRDCLLYLIQRDGVLVDRRKNCGKTALMLAAERGYVDCLEVLVSHGADLNSRDGRGRNALMHAARNHQHRCVEWLLECGCPVDLRDADGASALLLALGEGESRFRGHISQTQKRRQSVEALLKGGADVNLRDRNGRSPLLLAETSPMKDAEMLELLLRKTKVRPEVSVLEGEVFNRIVALRKVKVIHLLLALGISPAVSALRPRPYEHLPKVTDVGVSPLGVAVMCGHWDIALYFLSVWFVTYSDILSWKNYLTGQDLDERLDPSDAAQLSESSREAARKRLESYCSQPLPLIRLAQVVASTALGPKSKQARLRTRSERIELTKLPRPLQDLLMFRTNAWRACPLTWDELDPEFDPDRYSERPLPLPLDVYWPLGHVVSKCPCKDCARLDELEAMMSAHALCEDREGAAEQEEMTESGTSGAGSGTGSVSLNSFQELELNWTDCAHEKMSVIGYSVLE